jgi:hypothetical protein
VVDLKNFARELGATNKRKMERLHDAIYRGLLRSIPELVKESPIDTGQYAQSWTAEKTELGGRIGNHAPHAAVIEFGARPFNAPIGPLLAWAKRVLQDPSQPPHYSSHVWALAKHTQQKIAEQGMLPHHIMQNAIPSILENIKKEYENGPDGQS